MAKDRWHKEDALRPLTKEGEQQAARMFSLLRGWIEVEAIWTSPWVRARHTAEIASEIWKRPLREVEWLAGSSMTADLQRRLLPRDGSVALVGHEPDLGTLVGVLIGGRPVPLRKSGVALLEGDPLLEMELQALLAPKLVIGLAEGR